MGLRRSSAGGLLGSLAIVAVIVVAAWGVGHFVGFDMALLPSLLASLVITAVLFFATRLIGRRHA